MPHQLRNQHRSKLGVILLAYIAFISLGLPDGLMGVAWPSIRAFFGRPLDSLGVLLFAGTAGYLTSSFFSGRIMARLGVGGLLAASCAITGAGLIGYTVAPVWGVMIPLAVTAGLGAGAIDAGLNTYVAANFGEGLMQWLHASYGIGVTLGPIIMTAGLNVFGTWRLGYVVVGVAQILLATSFLFTLKLWQTKEHSPDSGEERKLTDYKTSTLDTLRQPRVWLSLLLFFLYTGAEATLGSWAYTLLTESRGIASSVAGIWAGSYWAMFTIGRMAAGLYTRHVGVNLLIRGSLSAAFIGAILLWWNPLAVISVIGVAMIGLAVAPIFPGLVSGTGSRVGARHAANTIGMQIGAAGLGAAFVPGFAGILARYISLEIIPIYLALLFAALFGLYSFFMRLKPLPSA